MQIVLISYRELFIHLWENRNRITIKGSVEAYLLTSLRNRILNHFRNAGVREKVQLDYARFVDELVSNGTAFIEQEPLRDLAEGVGAACGGTVAGKDEVYSYSE